MTARCKDSFSLRQRKTAQIVHHLAALPSERFLNDLSDSVVGCSSDDSVNLRKFLPDLLRIALRHAAGADQGPAVAFFLASCVFQNIADRFFLCLIDEAAGVDHNHICFQLIVRQLPALSAEQAKHLFGVDPVFVTAK